MTYEPMAITTGEKEGFQQQSWLIWLGGNDQEGTFYLTKKTIEKQFHKMDFFPKGNVLFAYGKFSSVLLGIGGFQFAGGGKNVCMMLYGWCFLWCMVGLPVFPLEVIFQQVVWLNVFCFHFARARLDPTMCDKWFGKHEMKSGHVDIQNVCKSGHVDIHVMRNI